MTPEPKSNTSNIFVPHVNVNNENNEQSPIKYNPTNPLANLAHFTQAEVINQLKENLHKLQLKDAVQRLENAKLRKLNSQLKQENETLKDQVDKLEAARQMVIFSFLLC